MSTRTVGTNQFVAAASAALITALSAWAFVSSRASIERDPFHFASIMAANTQVRIAQGQSRTASVCPNGDPGSSGYGVPERLSR
jgi:hypothetical protein